MTYLAWATSWILYWLGDLAYDVLCWFDAREGWVSFWYPVYNNLMIWSSDIQDRAYDSASSDWPWGQKQSSDS